MALAAVLYKALIQSIRSWLRKDVPQSVSGSFECKLTRVIRGTTKILPSDFGAF